MGVEVEIFGQKYMIRGNEDQEYICQLANYVDSKMRDVHGKIRFSTPGKIAVLAALNIAHELFTARKELEDHESVISEEAEKLLDLISLELKL